MSIFLMFYTLQNMFWHVSRKFKFLLRLRPKKKKFIGKYSFLLFIKEQYYFSDKINKKEYKATKVPNMVTTSPVTKYNNKLNWSKENTHNPKNY